MYSQSNLLYMHDWSLSADGKDLIATVNSGGTEIFIDAAEYQSGYDLTIDSERVNIDISRADIDSKFDGYADEYWLSEISQALQSMLAYDWRPDDMYAAFLPDYGVIAITDSVGNVTAFKHHKPVFVCGKFVIHRSALEFLAAALACSVVNGEIPFVLAISYGQADGIYIQAGFIATMRVKNADNAEIITKAEALFARFDNLSAHVVPAERSFSEKYAFHFDGKDWRFWDYASGPKYKSVVVLITTEKSTEAIPARAVLSHGFTIFATRAN